MRLYYFGKLFMLKKVCLSCCLTLLMVFTASANQMIHQQGSLIVDGQGQPIKLRGVLLEGWLMWNGPLWGSGLFNSESKIEEKIRELVGREKALWFRQQVYQTFITEHDIQMIAEMGFNVVRVPFNHTVLEDDDQPFIYKDSGWVLFDQLLKWCEKYGVYVVFDMHSAPGGQSGVFVNDPDGTNYFKSEVHIKRTAELWKAIASRYKNRHIVAGYDLLNEPQIPLFTSPHVLVETYATIIKAIRQVDTKHMVILSAGGLTSDDMSMFTETIDNNQALAFHTYNLLGSGVNHQLHKKYTAISKALNVPIWNGEIGAHTIEWVDTVINMFEDPDYNISGWIFWPWKVVPAPVYNKDRYRHLMAIETPPEWDMVANWVAGVWFAPKPNEKQALKGMQKFLESMKAKNLKKDSAMEQVLTAFKDRPAQSTK